MTFFDRQSDWFDRSVFKGTQSAGAHALQLPFHSIPLYITDTRSILFLTKYDKNNSKRLKINQNTSKIEPEF